MKKIVILLMLSTGQLLHGFTYTVINTLNAGAGSLRQAILDANGDGNPTAIIDFNIGSGVQQINLTTTLVITRGGLTINGRTQPGWTSGNPQIVIHGPGIGTSGMIMSVANNGNKFFDLVINNSFVALRVQGNNHIVQGCFFGTDATGMAIVANQTGFVLTGVGASLTIGGLAAGDRNIFGGNNTAGISCGGTGTIIEGNYIGVNAAGTGILANGIGVNIGASTGTVCSGNLISGNTRGIVCAPNTLNMTIKGNLIGTDVTGQNALPNGTGIQITGNTGTPITGLTIGGATSAERNIISGNTTSGIELQDSVNGALIENNYLGTNVDGDAALVTPGCFANINVLGGLSDITISKNLIAGNGTAPFVGLYLTNSISGVEITGNKIGTNAVGDAALGNGTGIWVDNSGTPITDVVIGGASDADDRNLISGNGRGIEIARTGDGTIVRNNFIGTDITGTVALANTINGMRITGPNDSSVIQDNVISGNQGDGIQLSGGSIAVTNATITGNKIGVDVTGTQSLPNNGVGIRLAGGATAVDGTVVGGASPALANIISANAEYGIFMDTVTNSLITGNFIGTNSAGTDLGNNLDGIRITGTTLSPSTNNLVGGIGTGLGNTIRFNGNFGVQVEGDGAEGAILNPILENSIYDNAGNGIELTDGGNHEQPAPVVGNAVLVDSTHLTVTVAAPTTPAASTFRIEIFINDLNRNPITEGQTFIGAFESVASGVIVTQTFTLTVPATTNQFVSATATNQNNPPVNTNEGDTSEFSDNLQITQVAPTPPSGPISCISQAILDKYCA